MIYRQFVVPDEVDILATIGTEPEAVDGEEPTVRQLRFEAPNETWLMLAYDLLARSVRLRWGQGDDTLIDLYREGAVRLVPQWRDQSGSIRIDFETDELSGALTVNVHPTLSISDDMLLT